MSDFYVDWTTLHAYIERVEDEGEREKYRVRLMGMYPKMIDLLDARLTSMITGAATAAPLAAPVAEPLQSDYSYDEFASLFEKYDRNVADSLRVWFKDIEGGYDASDSTQRVAIYSSAREYLDRKSKAVAAPGVAPSGNRKPYVAGDKPKRKVGPCPDCTQAGESTRKVTTKYGERYRCDEHDYWGNA